MMNRALPWRLVWLGLVALILLPLGVTPPTAAQSTKDVRALMAQAQAQGSVRVLVGVRAPFQPEGRLPASAVQTQRAALAQAQDAVLAQLPASSVRAVRKFEFIPFLALETDAAGLALLASAPNVTSIEPDRIRKPSLVESTALIGATNAWASGYAGAGWTVAILDSGVDKTHSFLSGKVVSEACYSTTSSTYGSTSVCPGGVSSSTVVGSGVNCSLTIDGCDHGTHVAGIAAGKGTTFSGVARDANIIAIQVFSRFDGATYCGVVSPCALSYDSDQISALQRVYALRGTYNIAAVNLSLGSGASATYCDAANPTYKAAIDNLRSVGIATIIASGNDGYTSAISEPACISTAVSVGSTRDGGSGATPVDTVSSFSNSASILNLLAPGQYIYSSVPGGGYANWAGTSMATPHVTGAWAVLKSRLPGATVDQVLAALTSTGVAVTDSRNGITKPRIRVDAALNALVPPSPPVPSQHFFPVIGKGAEGSDGWITILSTTFEGDFPGAWTVFDNDGATNGEYKLGARGCRLYAGSYSGWVVGAGANGSALACGSYYPSSARSWMVYGPFSLVNTTAAELRAPIWTQLESGYDLLCLTASLNGTNFSGTCYSGAWNWQEQTLNLANVYSLGSLLGQPNVWVAFVFQSDSSITYPEGAYVDNIVLRKCPTGATCPAAPAAPVLSGGVSQPANFLLK